MASNGAPTHLYVFQLRYPRERVSAFQRDPHSNLSGYGQLISKGNVVSKLTGMSDSLVQRHRLVAEAASLNEKFHAVVAENPTPVWERPDGLAIVRGLGVVSACGVVLLAAGIAVEFDEGNKNMIVWIKNLLYSMSRELGLISVKLIVEQYCSIEI